MTELITATPERAEEAERLGDLDTAFRLWLEISSKTEKPEDCFQLSRIAFMLGKWQMAETGLLRTLETRTNSPIAVGMLGALFLERTDGDRTTNLEAARTWLLRSVEIAKSAPTLCLLGMVYLHLKEKEKAEEAWRTAIDVDEQYEEAYFNLGFLAKEEGNLGEAEALLRKSIQIDPKFLRAHAQLGALLLKQGRRLEADSEFRRCLEIDPTDKAAKLYFSQVPAATNPRPAS
jgi:tetratricopeptide (TPR) repeat protein